MQHNYCFLINYYEEAIDLAYSLNKDVQKTKIFSTKNLQMVLNMTKTTLEDYFKKFQSILKKFMKALEINILKLELCRQKMDLNG